MFSPSPVVRQEKQLPLRTHVPETEESESDTSSEPGDRPGPKEDPTHLVVRLPSDLEGDREGVEPEQEEVMGAEPSAHLELAILNGLDISSLPALRDLSTGVSTTVNIPWPPARMERATPEWKQRASQAMAFLLERRAETTAGMPPRPPRHHDTEGDMDCQDAQQHGLQPYDRSRIGRSPHRRPLRSPCRKWHLHMARPRRVGLAGSLVHHNAEWSSALLGHAGIRNRICRIIHLRARGVSRRGGIGPEGLEARGSRQQH